MSARRCLHGKLVQWLHIYAKIFLIQGVLYGEVFFMGRDFLIQGVILEMFHLMSVPFVCTTDSATLQSTMSVSQCPGVYMNWADREAGVYHAN